MTSKYIENLQEIESNLDPVNVLGAIGYSQAKIEKSGGEIRYPCPIHKGDGYNLAINVSTHEWYCHSKGCKGTGLIDLHSQATKTDFRDSAEQLANQFSIPIKFKEGDSQKKEYSHEEVLKCWEEAKSQGKDTYFSDKKLLPPPIAKFGKNPYGYYSTLIPMIDLEGKFKGFITLKTGKKKYNYIYDETIETAFTPLGEIQPEGEFYIGEGIATVQTAWEATQRKIPAISCGTWSNIEPVISKIKTKYPNSKPIVLIDCDEGGKGLEAAKMISEKFSDARFRKPSFESFPTSNNAKLTDFNDIISKCSQSLDEVRKQLSIELDISTIKENSKKETSKQNEAPAIKTDSKNHGRCETAGEALKKLGLIERIKNRVVEYRKDPNKVKISGISTKYTQLDEIIDGLQGGHLIILAGRTGMGKTFLALNMLKNIAIDQKIPATLYSLEMSNSQVFYRMISLISGIPSTKIKRGMISDKELEEVKAAVKSIENSPLFLTDEPVNSVLSTLSGNIHSICKTVGVRAIFIDHIGLISCGNNYKDNRANEMGKITMTTKIAAKQYNIPVICLAQRAGIEKLDS